MEHQVWQIIQPKGLGEPLVNNNNNAVEDVHLPISAAAGNHGGQSPNYGLGQEPVKSEYDATFFVNMTPTLSEKDYKRFVRSQAMKAYHAKRRRKAALEETQPVPFPSMTLDFDRIVNKYTQDPFVKFPVDLSPTTREFLHTVFTDPRGIVESYRQIQFGNGLNCGAAFYQTLANIADWVRIVGGTSDSLKSYMNQQEIQNTARALSLVRQMLLDPEEQLSQGVISAVTHLITYSIMNNDMVAAAHHLDGLEKIINLRGGFETLDYNIQAYISWGEVFLATTWDSKPRFTAPVDYYKRITAFDAPLTPGTISITKMIRLRYLSLTNHVDLFEELTRLNNIFQTEIVGRRALTPADGNVHNGICYHLASLVQPINFEDESIVVGEIMRLALFAYLLPTWKFIARLSSTAFDAAPQLKKLRLAMEVNEIEWGRLISLKAWVVVMGFLNAVELDDIRFWTRLWVNTLYELENRKAPPRFERMESGVQAQEIMAVGCLSLYVPKAVTSVIWLENFHGTKYREVVSRILGAI